MTHLPKVPETTKLSKLWADQKENKFDLHQIDNVLFSTEEYYPNVIEVWGKEGSGKTELLMHIVVNSIMPKKYCGIHIGGLACGVIYIDTDYHFNMMRLSNLVELRIEERLISFFTSADNHYHLEVSSDLDTSKSLREIYTESRKNLSNIHVCRKNKRRSDGTLITDNQRMALSVVASKIFSLTLKNFHFVRCHSSEQLAVTLHRLESVLESCGGNVGVVMVDSVSAFYWLDRWEQECGRMSVEETERVWLEVLRGLVADYGLAVLATRQAMMTRRRPPQGDTTAPGQTSGTTDDIHDEMGKSWQKYVQGKLYLLRDDTTHHPHTSIVQYEYRGRKVYSKKFTISSEIGFAVT